MSTSEKTSSEEQRKAEAQAHFERGKQLWSEGKKGEAMSEYNRAIALDSDSPARTALEMANRIMDFYDKQQFNP